MAAPSKRSFLIVDTPEMTEPIVACLGKKYEGSLFFTARDVNEAFLKIQNAAPTMVIAEYDLPKTSCLTLLERMRRVDAYEKIPFILMTLRSKTDEGIIKCAEKNILYLEKPFDLQFLLGIVEGVLASLRPPLREHKLSPNETIFKEGDPAGSLFLVKSGSLEISKISAGKKIVLSSIKEGEIVGEMAFVDKKPRSATAMALSECILVELPILDLESYLNSQPVWLRTVLTTLLLRLRGANETIGKLSKSL